MPIFGQKTSILLKLHYFMVIKVNRMPFLFRFFTKILLLSCQYLSKLRLFSKKHTALLPILVKKTSILSKTQCSHVLFLLFFMKNSCCRAHDWSKNVNFVKTTLYFGQKSHRMPFFFYFSRKNYCSYVNILSKKCPFSKRK